MQPSISNTSPAVIELLATLRAQHFSIDAWRQFLSSSWIMSRAIVRDNAQLTKSWLHLTLLLCMLTILILEAISVSDGPSTMLRMLPGLLLCLSLSQSTLFWILGLIRDHKHDGYRT